MIYQHKFIILSFSRAIINQSYGNAIYRINGNRAKMIYVSIENIEKYCINPDLTPTDFKLHSSKDDTEQT